MTGSATQGRRPDRAAFVIAPLLAALGALLIWDGGRIVNNAGYAGIGPGDVPRLIGMVLIVLAIATAISGLRGPMAADRPKQDFQPVLLILLGLGLQLILLKPLGFTVAAGILFTCTAAAFGKRRLPLTLPVGLVFAFIVYALFDRLLQLNLPAGPIETFLLGG